MKQCPNCKATYSDDSMSFCLNDGANLIFASEEAETVQMSFDKNPLRVNIPQNSAPPVFAAPPIQQSQTGWAFAAFMKF